MKLKKIITGVLAASLLSAAAPAMAQETSGTSGGIVIADMSGAAAICIDPNGSEYDGISLAADAVAGDIEAVTGQRPEIINELPESGVVIIAGVVNEELIENEGLSWEISESNEDIKSEDWERYQIQVKESENLTKIMVAGADKRGTIYGLFHISQDLCGVSPWIWWADVRPAQRDTLSFTAEEIETTSLRPSVNYRGIFLNNEAPSLSAYVKDRFGNYNYLFYANVCELLLRLKANYLWPAMWGNVFAEEGVLDIDKAKDDSNLNKLPEEERDRLANERIAEDYGVVISFSHHEPMIRSGLEWQNMQGGSDPVYTKPTENNVPLNEWNYNYNSANIYDFWNDGIERSGGFDNNLITIGMRGEGDSALKNPDGSDMTLQENVDLLKKAITDQKEILNAHGLADSPQMFAIYTEVQQYWYGYDAATNKTADALRDWDVLDDDIMVLCDDNFGYTRFLTYPDEREDRNWGMYYHFDMNGGAFSYKWINTVPLERVWDSMTSSYDYGIDDLWVVNVGDLKPLEFPISYFIDLAYDFDKWGTDNPNSTDEYTVEWIKQQFGSMLSEAEAEEVADIVTGYADMNGRCKPEIIFGSTFSTTKYNESQDELRKALELEAQAEKYKEKFAGTPLESAYFELVYHPSAATATVNKMLIYKGFNDLYADQGSMLANVYAALTNEMIEKDKSLFDDYNSIEGGKWNLIMNQKQHTCYTGWEDTSGSYPSVRFIEPEAQGKLTVTLPGSSAAFKNGDTASLPEFDSTELQQYPITLSTTGGTKTYSVTADKEWIRFSGNTEGSFSAGETFGVYVDYSSLDLSETGAVTITSGDGERVIVNVTANVRDVSDLVEKTHTSSNGNIVISAENYVQKGSAEDPEGRIAGWEELEKYGKWGNTMKVFPTTATFVEQTGNETSEVIDPDNAPWMEYRVSVPEDGEYDFICCFGHSNNILPDSRLRYGISVDGGAVVVNNSITDSFGVAGISGEWNRGTKYFGRCASTSHYLTAGEHTVRFLGYEPNVELQRIVITQEQGMLRNDSGWQGFADSFFGPDPTYYKGKAIVQQPLTADTPADASMIPGTVPSLDTGFISTITSRYNIALTGTMSDDAEAEVIIDGEAFAITIDPASGIFEATTDLELEAGYHEISVRLISGTGEIESAEFTSTRRRTDLIQHTFEDASEAELYTTYNEGDGKISASGGRITAQGFSNGWYENNGIKMDITDIMQQTAGLSLYASADVELTWSGNARLFIETVSPDGSSERTVIAESGEYNNNCVSLSGSCGAVPFSPGDKVYLCITQYSGMAYFDNIMLWYYPEAVSLFRHTFNTEKKEQAAMYETYTEGAGTVEGGSGTVLKYDKGAAAEGTAGIKIDLTKNFGLDSSMNGMVFGASARIKPGYSWNSGNSAEMFFEVVGENGTEKMPLCSADSSTFAETTELFDSETLLTLGENWLVKPLEGEAELEIRSGDHVYLCITSTNNPQWYDDITVYRQPGSAAEPEEPEIDEIVNEILLNPGMEERNASAPSYWDIPAKANDEDTVKVSSDSDAHRGETAVLVSERSSSASGAQQYVTLENNKTYDIGIWVKLKETDTVNLKIVYEYYDQDIVIGTEAAAGEWTYISGTYTTRGEGTVTQLVIDTANGTENFLIDDAAIAVSEEQPPKPEGIEVSDIQYSEAGKPYVSITNNSGEDADISIFTATYDGSGCLVKLSETSAGIPAGGNRADIELDASANDRVYIWDKNMKPLSVVMTAEQ